MWFKIYNCKISVKGASNRFLLNWVLKFRLYLFFSVGFDHAIHKRTCWSGKPANSCGDEEPANTRHADQGAILTIWVKVEQNLNFEFRNASAIFWTIKYALWKIKWSFSNIKTRIWKRRLAKRLRIISKISLHIPGIVLFKFFFYSELQKNCSELQRSVDDEQNRSLKLSQKNEQLEYRLLSTSPSTPSFNPVFTPSPSATIPAKARHFSDFHDPFRDTDMNHIGAEDSIQWFEPCSVDRS